MACSMKQLLALLSLLTTSNCKAIFDMSSVVPDTNITMKCHHGVKEVTTTAVWWFNGQIIFASNEFLPEEIGFKNVRGTLTNSTTSFLNVESIKVQNEGNYTCAFGKESIVTYIVKLQRTGGRKETHVIHGANISMSCTTARETTLIPIWYFNNSAMTGEDSFRPEDIGLKNVRIDPNKAFMYVDSFSTQNEGNYKCTLGEKAASNYHLKCTPLSLSLYCAGQECPGMLSLNTTLTVLEMECYGDQMTQADQHSWKINDLKTDFETKIRSFPSETPGLNVTVRGSMKTFALTKYPNHAIIGCTVGDVTKTVIVIVPRVASEILANDWKPAAITGILIIIVICFFLFQKINATEMKILLILAEIKAEIRELKRQTVINSHLIHSIETSHLDLEELPNDIHSTLASVPFLTALDERAQTDVNVEKRLIFTLSSVGGQILSVAVRRMLRELILNDVAIRVNWTGQGEKLAFKDLFLCKVLEKTIKKNQHTSNSMAVEVQREVVRFFKGASDKEGGLKARQQHRIEVQFGTKEKGCFSLVSVLTVTILPGVALIAVTDSNRQSFSCCLPSYRPADIGYENVYGNLWQCHQLDDCSLAHRIFQRTE
ncbi:uncharacterized protein [Apostichopus japonicus]|uniref:uncharacterized protein n=1 Tax=Stichopus japonicus TaxID=307972 RepID=UPI003AB30BF6